MYHFYVQGERDGKGPGTSACHYVSMTEQTNTFRSTNNYYGNIGPHNTIQYNNFVIYESIWFLYTFG